MTRLELRAEREEKQSAEAPGDKGKSEGQNRKPHGIRPCAHGSGADLACQGESRTNAKSPTRPPSKATMTRVNHPGPEDGEDIPVPCDR
jgi:hypothetical protein